MAYWVNRVLESFKWVLGLALLVVAPLVFVLVTPHPRGGPIANLPGALLFLGAVIVLIVAARGVNLYFTNQPRSELVARLSPPLVFTARLTGASYRRLREEVPSRGLSLWVATNPLCVLGTHDGVELYAVSALHTPERVYLLSWRDIEHISSGGTWLTRNHIHLSQAGELPALELVVQQDSLVPTRRRAEQVAVDLRAGMEEG